MTFAEFEDVLPEDTEDTAAMNEFVDRALELLSEEDTAEVIGFLESLEGDGRPDVQHLTAPGYDFYHYFADAVLSRHSSVETPEYDRRDSVSLTSKVAFSEPLWDVFIDRNSDIDHDAAKDSFYYFSNGWNGSRSESAPLQEYAFRLTDNQNGFEDQEWWDSRDVAEEDLEEHEGLQAVKAYSQFQQEFLKETFAPEDGVIYGFRSFRDENVLDEHAEIKPDGSVELESAPIEHWSPSPSASANYARDSNGDDHGYMLVDKIPVDKILGAGVASSAFAMNIPEMFVLRNETEVYDSKQVIAYEEADMIELAAKAANQVGEIPESLRERYDIE